MVNSILVVANVASHFGGNFIESLKMLDDSIKEKKGDMCYCFPISAKSSEWIECFKYIYFIKEYSIKELKSMFDKAIKERKIDIVHYHFLGFRESILCNIALKNRAKSIYHFHNHVSLGKGVKRYIKRLVHKLTWSKAAKIAVSEGVAESIRTFSSNKLFVVYNGLDLKRLENVNKEEEIDDTKNACKLMIMGNHYERKGVDFAAKAVKFLNEEGILAVLYIVASPNMFDEVRKYVRIILRSNDFETYIKLIPSRNDIATYFNKIDIFLSTSREEGFTWAIDEAIYCGCEVIATDISGQRENKVPGFWWVSNPSCSLDLEQEIVRTIRLILKDNKTPMKHAIKIEKARKYIENTYSIKKWADRVIEVYLTE